MKTRGIIRILANKVQSAPNARRDVRLRGPLAAALGLPVEMENAAKAFALALVFAGASVAGAGHDPGFSAWAEGPDSRKAV